MAKLIKKGTKKERKPPRFRGHPPHEERYPHATVLHSFFEDDTDWELWFVQNSGDWDNYKLIAKQKRRKSNFWFGWLASDLRVSSMGDHRKLEEHYPKTFQEVVRFLTENTEQQ